MSSFFRKFFFLCFLFFLLSFFLFSSDDFGGTVIFPHLNSKIKNKPLFLANCVRDKNLILLNSAIFDPLKDGEPDLSMYVENREKFSGSESEYFLIQFKDKITPVDKKKLMDLGYKIYWYVPNNALLVGGDSNLNKKAIDLKNIRWIGEYQPGFKISDEIASFLTNKDYPFDTKVPELGITLFDRKELSFILDYMVKEFGSDKSFSYYVDSTGLFIRVGISDSNVREFIRSMANIKGVSAIDVAHERTLKNDNSMWVCQSGDTSTHATPIFEHGIMGQGEIVGVTDSGIRTSSCFFINAENDDPIASNYTSVPPPGNVNFDLTYRKVIGYNVLQGADFGDEESNHYHGTHVCGSVGGDNINTPATTTDPGHDAGDGMAPLAKIFFEDAGAENSGGLFIPAVYDLWQQIYNVGARISSNSWGGGEGGYYDSSCVFTDYFTYLNEDFLIFFAAGNAGPLGDTLDYEANAKNIVTVGATKNGSTGAMDVARFSSKGPAGDGRIKPDLCAPGEDIISAYGGSDCATWSMSGTSMATPTAAGLAALVRCYYEEGFYPTGEKNDSDVLHPSAALVKATLINSCVNMTGSNTSGGLGREDAPSNGQGWGRITLDNALYFSGDSRKLIVYDCRNGDGITTNMVREYSFSVNSSKSGEPLKVTLVWSDPPAVEGSAVQLVDDLDLELVAPDGTVYKGNQWNDQVSGDQKESQPNPSSKDYINNVEQVYIKTPQAGVYTLRVIGANVPGFRNFNKQGYAFVITGDVSNSNVSYLNVLDIHMNEKNGNGDNLIDPGESFYFMIGLKNDGNVDFHNVSATISCNYNGVTIDNPTIDYGDIPANTSATSSATTPVINFDSSIERGIDIPFSVTINSDEGSFTREFSLRVVNLAGPPILEGVSISDEGPMVSIYPQYEQVRLNCHFMDSDYNLKYIYIAFYVNGKYLFTLKDDVSKSDVFGQVDVEKSSYLYPFAFFATNVGETLKVGVFLEDADSNFSCLMFSNEIVLNGGSSSQTAADLGDDDSLYLPLNFNFPFYGRDYDGIWVNSDGNITLSAGYDWMDRTLDAFRQLMPRIAPLYSDIAKDSGNGSQMSIDNGSNYVTVSWNGVGQWSDTGPVGLNTFSVTLKDTGEIDFNYGQCTVSASQDGVKAIVGITPGDNYPLQEMYFAGSTSEIYYPSNYGLYHVYKSDDNFDLSNKTITFIPGEGNLTVNKTIYFPVLNYGNGKNTGYGFVNASDSPALVKFTAFKEDGNVLATSSQFLWKPENQGAFEVGSIFSGLGDSVGWIKAETDGESLRGFFLAEDFSNNSLTGLDGASGFDGDDITSDTKVISEVKGSEDFETTLNIVNLGDSSVDFAIEGFSEGGAKLDTKTITIPANGSISNKVSDIFGSGFDGYVKISNSQGVKFIANALIRDGDKSTSSLNGVDVSKGSKTLYVPHAVYWKDLYYTEVSLVNVDTGDATVNVYFYNEDGTSSGSPLTYTIPQGGIKVLKDADLGLDTSLDKSLGWVKIESDKKLVGSMEFGNPVDDHYRATLPLMLTGKDDIYFSQVANGTIGGVDYWTGVALINPTDSDVRINIEVYKNSGELVGMTGNIVLKSHQKLVNMLRGLQNMSGLPDQSSGYVHITSSAPIFAFELFGDNALNFISSVSAQ